MTKGNKILLLIVGTGAFLMLVGLALLKNMPSPAPSEFPPYSIQRAQDIETQAECEAEGGTWKQWGLIMESSCNIPTSDAQKPCTDGSQCESGVCLAGESGNPERQVQGTCYGWQRLLGGCFTFIEEGKIDGAVCVD